MKTLLIIISFIVVILILSQYFRPTDTNSVPGKLTNIQEHITKLMTPDSGKKILIVTISEPDDFIQFTGDKTGIQLDLPQVSKRQKELNSKFNFIAQDFGLIVINNEGTDGTKFLDINIHGEVSKVSNIASKFIKKLYDITEETDIIFTTN